MQAPALRHDAAHAFSPPVSSSSGSLFGLGRWVTRHPWLIVVGWLLLAGLLAAAAPPWNQACRDDDIRFLPAECESVRGYDLMRQAFPKDAYGSRLVLILERTLRPFDAADHRLIAALVKRIELLRGEQSELGIVGVQSELDWLVGHRLRSSDGHCSLVVVSLATPFLASRTRHALAALETDLRPWFQLAANEGLTLTFSGPAAVGRDLGDAVESSFHDTTFATVGLVLLCLLLIYRSPLLALVPLATICIALWISFSLLALLARHGGLNLVNITPVFVVVILFGVGTDYCLFLVSRCQEERRGGHAPRAAVAEAVGRVGWALAASAGTVICGLGMMAFAEFAKLRATGPALAVSLVVALAASLTLAPALLALLGGAGLPARVRGTRKLPAPSPEDRALARGLLRHPGKIWLATLLSLIPFALAGGETAYDYAVLAELPAQAESRRGLLTVQRRYAPGEVGPVTLLLNRRECWTLGGGTQALDELTQRLAALPGVAEVRSLAAPLGQALPVPSQAVLASLAGNLARQHYLGVARGEHVARFEVILKSDPYTAASIATLKVIRRLADHSLRAAGGDGPPAIFGVTALMGDVARVQRRDSLRTSLLVIASIQLIMLLLVRRPLIAGYLMLTVLLSYFATLGMTTLLGPLLLANVGTQLDWKVPFFLFTILMAVGQDYNIFLMSRVLEEEPRHGLAVAACRAVLQTGTIITSCGLIMAGTFATLMLGDLVTLRQMGLALCIGVLLDTFLVRLFLVPSFLVLLARWQADRTPPPRRWLARLRGRAAAATAAY